MLLWCGANRVVHRRPSYRVVLGLGVQEGSPVDHPCGDRAVDSKPAEVELHPGTGSGSDYQMALRAARSKH